VLGENRKNPTIRRRKAAWLLGCWLMASLILGCKHHDASDKTLTLFGAASTTDVMNELAKRFEARTGTKVRTSFASSATVARQIEAGAHADAFISANLSWMDHLERKGLLEPGTRRDLLGNRLVLIAPAARGFELRLERGSDLGGAFEGKLALADPAHAPAGRYAKESLERFGWWEALEPRVLPCKDVRATVAAVEAGSVGAGVVYATDAAVSKRIKIAGTFPDASHAPIRYPIALVKGSKPGARELLEFLSSEEARKVYEAAGFVVLDGTGG
jgi:molybdate transport system substrate-binding protein